MVVMKHKAVNVEFAYGPTQDAEVGAVKNARGLLVGWTLPDEEKARLYGMVDPEIVLQQRPTQLLIKLKAPTNKLQNTYGEGNRMIHNMISKQII